jgi:hypothetical protein
MFFGEKYLIMGAEGLGLVVNTCIAVVFWTVTADHLDATRIITYQ